MPVAPVNNMVLVVKNDKASHKKQGGFIAVAPSNNLGVVKYSSNELYPVGTQVYYGGHTEQLIVEGAEVLAMKVENIIAVLTE